ncbi:MAG: threonylcarbamoyl-AMP synthase [Planctomycetota bacterium]|nr:MAG: threonylcarbamoyl-AMP synthase [Planctomycetota bacterium]REJ93915.1 MAG: threonylcarbamoyl-AMP synthase [Planctomycetota bacterium]REK20679.1 MAG: threonylcarbamoyl-AMP synthase [Planctomycetota bacterium]REK38139.1 MAG: threonylcarbamoyl-AMP synthase [Planctomycetota bacterium]
MTAQRTRDVHQAAEVIRNGGLVAFPTETVYGLGANALNPDAVARIFEAKQRPKFDPLIVHVADRESLDQLVTDFPHNAKILADRFWPGPLTLVLPKQPIVPDLVTAGLQSVGARIPDHPLALEILRAAAVPIAAPSANRFGCVSPTNAEHVREQLGDRIDLILDGGPCRVGVESTVVLMTEDPPLLLRPGGVALEDLESAIGPVTTRSHAFQEGPQVAPGQLTQHYAPQAKVLLTDDPGQCTVPESAGLLAFRVVPQRPRFAQVEILSPAGDLKEAAFNLFAALRRLDAAGLDLIIAERVPEKGLGRAINDRLRRASAPTATDPV